MLRNVSAEFPTGRNVGVLGLNGAGKSTTLRIIAGIEPPDSGKIERAVSISWPVGFSGSFSADLSGRHNVRFLARLYGAGVQNVESFVEEHAGLGEYFDHPVRSYSSGMKARLSTSASLAIPFDCYIIDEALATGDRRFQARFDMLLKRISERASIFIVSHQITQIERYADMVCVLNAGNMHVFDRARDGITYYNRYVAPIE
ncbi:ABC transporter ATP-binding protein [Telmatospirillum sp. J64-1]|uniref:ABC transporter ATP-binding protein n=1 Tax=Telmatospirillum sp. J64-1 TaxID=2502183 RepID=UPI00163D9153|nr:ATP-binding cassette domain-containing protein [Telmatospirillum sp. J64-1]